VNVDLTRGGVNGVRSGKVNPEPTKGGASGRGESDRPSNNSSNSRIPAIHRNGDDSIEAKVSTTPRTSTDTGDAKSLRSHSALDEEIYIDDEEDLHTALQESLWYHSSATPPTSTSSTTTSPSVTTPQNIPPTVLPPTNPRPITPPPASLDSSDMDISIEENDFALQEALQLSRQISGVYNSYIPLLNNANGLRDGPRRPTPSENRELMNARSLREEQDRAYQQSLEEDRKKEQQKEQQEIQQRLEQENEILEEAKKFSVSLQRGKRIDDMRNRLPAEPTPAPGVKVVDIVVVLPPNGLRVSRKFLANESILTLLDWVVVVRYDKMGEDKGEQKGTLVNEEEAPFELVMSFPKIAFSRSSHPPTTTLEQIGLYPRALLNLRML